MNRDPCVARIGRAPESCAADPFRFIAASPFAVTRVIPNRTHLPPLNASTMIRLPAFDTPAEIVNRTDVLERFPHRASQLNDAATVVVVVVATTRLRHAKSVNRDAPEALNAATEKHTCDPGARPATDHSVTLVPTLYGHAATVVPAGTGRSFR